MSNSKVSKKTGNSKRNTPQPLHCDKFEKSRLSYTELDTENERIKSQFISYPRYTDEKYGENSFVFQTDWMKITQYGLPSLGEYYKTDSERNFLKVPLDPNQDGCNSLENMLTQVDEYTEENKKNILGKFAKLYTYQPIVREPASLDDLITDDDEDEDKKKPKDNKVRFKYCKMKLDTTYPDGEIKTNLYVRDSETDKPTYTPVSNATQLSEYVNWGSEVRMIVMVNKLWAAKNKDKSGTRSYGTAMKILQLEVKPRQSTGSIRNQFSRYAFDDDNEDDSDESNDSTEDASVDDDDLDAGVDEEDNEDNDDDDDDNDEDEGDDEDDEDDDENEEADEEAVEDESSEEVVKPTKKKKNKSKSSKK